ncbi:hypothetical protein [Capnocytophaga stomatis]|uniref:hypothetical protein n=1 Tax=Capnocytophaga stomatis TaxID=1848904 RepID=UPI00194F68D0|nr:hypothetical protein [Capnocytophaga stomatis]
MKLLTKRLKMRLFALVGLLAFGCAKNEKQEKIVEVEVEKHVVKDFDLAKASTVTALQVKTSGTEMFTEEDNKEVNGKVILYNDDLRAFRVNEMLEVRAIEGNKYRIRNFLPHTFTNVELQMYVEGFKAPVKIAFFEEFPPLYEYVGDLPFSARETFFEDINGQKFSVENINNLSPSDLKFSLISNDPMLEKMKAIKLNTLYCFRPYERDNKWGKLTAEDARNYLPVVMNMAYMFSSDDFEKGIKETPYEFENKKGVALNREQIIRSFIEIPRQDLGVIIEPGLGGLGGGSTFGVRREYINNPKSAYYTKSDLGAPWFSSLVMNVWIHEFGHVAGYGHDGNMTYFYDKGKDAKGLVPVGMAVYQKLLLDGELPFTKYPYEK